MSLLTLGVGRGTPSAAPAAVATKIKAGTYIGNGSDNLGVTGVGFAPDFVMLKGGSTYAVFRTSTMAGDNSKLGDGSALAANQIQSLDSDGFTVGDAASVNTNLAEYHYLAIRAGNQGDCKVGSYTGTGGDDVSVTGVGFQPNLVIVMGAAGRAVIWRTSDHASDISSGILAASAGDIVQAFEADGFQVGTNVNANANTETFYYFAMKNITGAFQVLTYTGNGSDDRSISGAGFLPTHVWTKRLPGVAMVLRGPGHATDEATRMDTSTDPESNLIQAFESDGFQVGNDAAVNQNTITFNAACWKDVA